MPFKTWNRFTAAPHRVMFFGGALQAVAVMLWWIYELVTRFGIAGQPATWTVIPVAAHAYLMIYGLFSFFMFGFLMTVFPRWMNGKEIPAQRFVPAFLLLMLGAAGFYAGLFGNHAVLVGAVGSTLAGWGWAIYALLRVLLDTTHPDKRHPKVIFIALGLGWCSLVAYLAWLIKDHDAYLRFAVQGGVWLFMLPVFASVAHRMLPFFTSSALPQYVVQRPDWPWWILVAGSVVHALLQFASMGRWQWLCDFPMAVSALYLTYTWGLVRSLRIPLLAILHIGFAWIGIAMLLFGIQDFLSFINESTIPAMGLAPLHALTIGCFATLLIGMGTRVTHGHSGLPMQVGTPFILIFAGIQLAALMRVLADILPIQDSYLLYIAAAAVWLACFTPWVVRYLPVYWRPRVDGQAG
ncbi:MAG: NnrS family protein [Gammaproteobacteria bacterium]|nr:NnrS family protein [Gammaproteobacteria bacterium]MBU1482701.1 NnrS family protein [Gammaproteobacteria bacterium]